MPTVVGIQMAYPVGYTYLAYFFVIGGHKHQVMQTSAEIKFYSLMTLIIMWNTSTFTTASPKIYINLTRYLSLHL